MVLPPPLHAAGRLLAGLERADLGAAAADVAVERAADLVARRVGILFEAGDAGDDEARGAEAAHQAAAGLGQGQRRRRAREADRLDEFPPADARGLGRGAPALVLLLHGRSSPADRGTEVNRLGRDSPLGLVLPWMIFLIYAPRIRSV